MGMTEQMAIEELIDFMYNVMDDSDEEAIPFVKNVIESLEEIQQYRAIGTVEECEKYKRGCIIANVTFDKEKLQEIVNEKIKEVELDANAIRNKAIEEFAEWLKNKLVLRYGNATLTEQYVAMQVTDWCNEIAESMKGEKE